MPSELKERIVGLVDAAAPPIDVESLAQQLAARDERQAVGARCVPPLRRRMWAFAVAFCGVLVLVGGALAGGVWLHEPTSPDRSGFGDATTATGSDISGWWWIALALVVMGLGAAAYAVGRRRAERPGEEDVMQTLEQKVEPTSQSEVAKLARQRRWLVVALALVVLVAAVAIGWLIAENRSLSSDLEAAVWPAESELTALQQHMLNVAEDYQAAWDNDDLDTLMAFYTPTATHEMGGASSSNEDGRLRATLESWQSLGASTTFGPGLGEKVSTVVLGNDVFLISASRSMGLYIYRFSFASGEEPLIEKSEMIGMAP